MDSAFWPIAGSGTALVVALVIIEYRSRWLCARLLANDLRAEAEAERQRVFEFRNEANYWRELAAWLTEHHDRFPTKEECDLMWARIVAKSPASSPSLITPDGPAAKHASLADLVRSCGGRLV